MEYLKTYKVLDQGHFMLAISEGGFAGENLALITTCSVLKMAKLPIIGM
ncbi:MAG: hypothetical protein ACI8SJ_001009 [Shewanella sp.]|jgi:hypothetical protein